MFSMHNQHDEEARDLGLEALVDIIERETRALRAQMPEALVRQWESSPVPKPREDSGRSSSGSRPADPTAETVLDARRLAVRQTVKDAEAILKDAAARLVLVNRQMHNAIDRFDGGGRSR